MNKIESGTGEYEEWDKNKKEAFLDKAMMVMERYCLKYLGAVVPLEEFKRLDMVSKGKLQDPYFVALEDTILNAGCIADELFPHSDRECIEILCDREEKFQAKALKVFNACEKDIRFGHRLAAFGFGRMDRVLPLQAADLVAYELLRCGRMLLDPNENVFDSPRPLFKRLVDKKMVEFETRYTVEDLKKRTPFNYTS